MENVTFGMKELEKLIEEKLHPYLLETREKTKIEPEMFDAPTQDIQNKLSSILRELLKNQAEWTLETFLTLACGFLYAKVFDEIGIYQSPVRNSTTQFNVFNIYAGKEHYLMPNLPAIDELKLKYRYTYIFVKKNITLFYVNDFGEPVEIKIDKTKLKNLFKKVSNINQSKSLQQSLSAKLAAQFSEIISLHRHQATLKNILQQYNLAFKNPNTENNTICKTPAEWLKLLQDKSIEIGEISINPLMCKAITCHHFKLDEEKAENGVNRGEILNIEQAADYLKTILGKNIGPQQILDYAAQDNDLNAYILSGKTYDEAKKSIPSIKGIENEIENGLLDRGKKYRFSGLIQLLKNNKNIPPCAQEHTIEHLANGNEIITEVGTYFFHICRQLSLSEYIFGESFSIRIKDRFKKITLNDIFFRKEELEHFCNKNKPGEIPWLISLPLQTQALFETVKGAGIGIGSELVKVAAEEARKNIVKKNNDLASSSTLLLSDENIKKFEHGEKRLKEIKEFSQKGGAAMKEKALKKWPLIYKLTLEKIINPIEEKISSGYPAKPMTAISLAKKVHELIENDTKIEFETSVGSLRKELRKHPEISKYIKKKN
jgi:hypothetical protein